MKSFLRLLLFLPFFMIGITGYGQECYGLVKVTSVEDRGLYVFDNNSHVLNGIVSSNGSLQTLSSYSKENLKGNESYVWKLEAQSEGYYVRNMTNPNSTNLYLKNPSSNILSLGAKETVWTFTFVGDSAIIRVAGGSGLGDTGIYRFPDYKYKLYTNANLEKTFHGFTVYRLVDSSNASITSAEYATFSSPYALDFSAESGLTVYTATVNAAKMKVSLHEVTSKKIPANTAVVLHGTQGTYTGSIVETAENLVGNDLKVATSEMSGAEHSIYVLNKKNGVLGFYKLSNTGKLEAGKAYLTLNASAPMLTFTADEVTSVGHARSSVKIDSLYFTLDGRRVMYPSRGVFIHNGRKVVIK